MIFVMELQHVKGCPFHSDCVSYCMLRGVVSHGQKPCCLPCPVRWDSSGGEHSLIGSPMGFCGCFFDGCCFFSNCNFFISFIWFFLWWGWGSLDFARGERWWAFQTTNSIWWLKMVGFKMPWTPSRVHYKHPPPLELDAPWSRTLSQNLKRSLDDVAEFAWRTWQMRGSRSKSNLKWLADRLQVQQIHINIACTPL